MACAETSPATSTTTSTVYIAQAIGKHLEAHVLTGTFQAVQDILGRRRDLAVCHHQNVRL